MYAVQAAVPKFMQLRLDPASSTTLAPNNMASVQQKLYVNNTMHGTKPLAMRLRITYTSADGQQMVEQAEVSSFPADL